MQYLLVNLSRSTNGTGGFSRSILYPIKNLTAKPALTIPFLNGCSTKLLDTPNKNFHTHAQSGFVEIEPRMVMRVG